MNKIYISPLKTLPNHIQVYQDDNQWIVTISSDHEILIVSDKHEPKHINNRDKQWAVQFLQPISETTQTKE